MSISILGDLGPHPADRCPNTFAVVPLMPSVQHYPWGDTDFIPHFLGRKNPEARPFAELWFGAHPEGPAAASLPSGPIGLDKLIAESPEAWLHAATQDKFGARLPYLLKILSAAAPLSLQLHPTAKQAAVGFALENAAGIPLSDPKRNYKDASHKPELMVALVDFYGVCGFRPWEDITERLRSAPELSVLTQGFQPSAASCLLDLCQHLLTVPQNLVNTAIKPWLERLEKQHQDQPYPKSAPEYWILESSKHYNSAGHYDRGLVFFYLLNLVHLLPGQALYVPAGVLHAYLQGSGVELMANSNNVLRGGLTRKHIDVAELLNQLIPEPSQPKIITAQCLPGTVEWKYRTPAEEFELSCIELTPGATHQNSPNHCADILIVTSLSPGHKVAISAAGERAEFGQGAAFLIPRGVAYRLEATGPAVLYKATTPEHALTAQTMETHGMESLFRGRQPKPLAFGTSGLRGLVTDITDLEAYINSRGFLDYLLAIGEVAPGGTVCLGGDLRPSTNSPGRSIVRAVARAVQDAGLVPDWLGPLPTPALSFYAFQKGVPSIMVTGSHIPFDRNGIKFNKRQGEVLKADEPGILRAVAKARQTEYSRPSATSLFDDSGMFKSEHWHPLPAINPQATQFYLRRYQDFFGPGALLGLRVLFYQHSAVGRDLMVELLRSLGAEVVPASRSEQFVPIDTEALSQEKLDALQAMVDEASKVHGRIDAAISTDGDSDRPLAAGVDAAGRVRFISGDLLGVLVAGFLEVDAAAVPVSANDAVDLWSTASGAKLIKTRIGSPYVIEGMRQAYENGARRVAGWEANGGFLLGSPLSRNGRTLAPLPTRDAALPLLSVLAACVERKTTLAELAETLPRRFSRSGLIDEFPTEISRALVERFSPPNLGTAQVEFHHGRVYLASGNAQPSAVDGPQAQALKNIQREIEAHFRPENGFGAVERIDPTDGVRIWFHNGDIAHVRPSGNAPQLRIYAVASTPQRAEEIVALGLREPDGILRQLEAHVRECGRLEKLAIAVRHNIQWAQTLFARRETPELIGTVSGSRAAQQFWQSILDQAKRPFGARTAVSFVEDLPTNQAFGLLLLWQRLKDHLAEKRGALVAFVFGEGTRSTPFTETENGQKPALPTFVQQTDGKQTRYLSMVELAMWHFVPVQQYMRRSGFDGVVVKWGDEVQIPALDLTLSNPLFAGADVVRFVSIRAMDEDTAKNKDWVGVDANGQVTAFIPRRPLKEMGRLADRGLLQRREGQLFGGVNLGSIGLSRALLDILLAEFRTEVNDATANRKNRPALDPEFFTALAIALMPDAKARAEAWSQAQAESPDVAHLAKQFPDIIARLERAAAGFQKQNGRPIKMVAMDFGDQYWGDVGQHAKIYEFFMALNAPDAMGDMARALAGIPSERDAQGNIVAGSTLAPGIQAQNSVIINAHLTGKGRIANSVLIGTRAGNIQAESAFDILSTVREVTLESRAGMCKVVAVAPIHAAPGERLTTLFLPNTGSQLLRVQENTDLKNRAACYDVPIMGNPISFQQAHNEMSTMSMADLSARRQAAEALVLEGMPSATKPLSVPV